MSRLRGLPAVARLVATGSGKSRTTEQDSRGPAGPKPQLDCRSPRVTVPVFNAIFFLVSHPTSRTRCVLRHDGAAGLKCLTQELQLPPVFVVTRRGLEAIPPVLVDRGRPWNSVDHVTRWRRAYY